jgi:hypothetical protein
MAIALIETMIESGDPGEEMLTSIKKLIDKSAKENGDFRPHYALADHIDDTVSALSLKTGLDEVAIQKALFYEITQMYGADIADEIFQDFKHELTFNAEWDEAAEGGLDSFLNFHREKAGDNSQVLDFDNPESLGQFVEKLKQLLKDERKRDEGKEGKPPISW